MRILSQDGMIDVPYENFVFAMTADNCIVAIRDRVARLDEIVKGVVAKYSTEAKARKAMEMLRKAFENYDWIKTTGNSDELKRFARVVSQEVFDKTTSSYFQFPADDEVEVENANT
ncbi:MAG: hypothetical protein ACLRZ9_05985 [Eubacterium sp.]